jgi:hypothetical protein
MVCVKEGVFCKLFADSRWRILYVSSSHIIFVNFYGGKRISVRKSIALFGA